MQRLRARVRPSWPGALIAALLCFGGLWAPSALAAGTVGSFEVDGNLIDSPGGEPIDWSTPPPNLTNFTDKAGSGDDIFSQGSKELEPGGWSCVTGKAPGKDDIVSGQVAFRRFPASGGDQFVYVDYTRSGVNGDAHIDYEFSQSSLSNPACPALPQRTNGDIVITFDTEQGGAQIFVRAFRWVGNLSLGTFQPLPTGSEHVTFDGAVNIPNTIPGHTAGDFGEASLNLTDTIGEIACGQFAKIYMKTRASTSIDAALKDRTAPQTANLGECPISNLAKAVRNVTDGQQFTNGGPTSTTAKPADTIEYRLTYTNSGAGAAHQVKITEPLPDRSTFLSCTGGCTFDAQTKTITWELGTVEALGTRVVTFRVKLDSVFPAGTTTIKNVATVDTAEEPPKPSNETTVTVTAAPKLALVKSADKTSVAEGDQITYTLAFSNTGNADAGNVVITEQIPSGTSFVSCSNNCTHNGTATWSIGTVPAGGSGSVTLTVRVDSIVACQICNTATISSPNQNGGTPISSNQLCIDATPGPNPAGANAHDSAFGAFVFDEMLAINQTLTPVDSSKSGVGSDSESDEVLDVAVPPTTGDILRAQVLRSESTSTVSAAPAEARHVSSAEAVGVNVLNGAVTADFVRAVAETVATGAASSFNSDGTTFKNVRVNGQAVNDVKPNTRVDLPAAVFGAGSYVLLFETVGSTSRPPANQLSGGTYEADLTVNAIHVFVTDRLPLVPGNQTTEVIVSDAVAHSDFPQTTLCEPQADQSVSGHAFIASEQTNPALLPVLAGFVSIPSSGGHDHQHLDSVMLGTNGDAVTAAASDSDSAGTLSATSSTASSYAQAANVCALRMGGTCTVSAVAVKSQSNSTADAGGAFSDANGTQLVGVVVDGAPPINATPPPNTVINLDGLGFVVLNEQFCDNGGTLANNCSDGTDPDHSGLTVRAIRVVLTNPAGGPPGAEVIVAEAHSDATFVP